MRRLTELYRDPVMGVPHRDRRWLDGVCCVLGIGLYAWILAWSATHPAIPKDSAPSIFVVPPSPHADPPAPVDSDDAEPT